MTAVIAINALSLKKKHIISIAGALALVVLAVFFLWRGFASRDGSGHWDVEVSVDPLPVSAVEEAFAKLDYDVMKIRNGYGVPRVLVRTVPDYLGQVPEVDRRKGLFLSAVLPLVLAVNEQIMRERDDIEGFAKKTRVQKNLKRAESEELERLARVYRVIDDEDVGAADDLNETEMIDELLLRAAPLPVSLVLAQAAEESAWGLSRFAAEGNALYGQWVWNDEAGIIPKDRITGQTHSVRAFRDIYESTLAYAYNLNTHRAYEPFRRMLANMKAATGHLDGQTLAGALTRYSGRGQAYVESLRSIIRANDLAALDRARFIGETSADVVQSPTGI